MIGYSPNAVDSQRKYMRRMVELEETARLQKEIWKKKPLIWLRERLGEDPANFKWSIRPGYEDHVWDGDKDPLSEAWMALARGEWAGVEAATGTSKTYWLARVVFWFLDCFEDSMVVTSAPKQEQLNLHLWAEIGKIMHKFRKLQPDSKLLTLKLKVKGNQNVGEMDDEQADLDNSWMAVGFVAGTGADEASATKAQGFHRRDMLIILEETPGMSAPVLTAFKNTSTGDHNLILAVGNPDSELDPLHEFCELDNVRNFRISAFDYPNVVHGVEIFPGAVTRASIERRRIEYGEDSLLYRSRVKGICPTSAADSLIKLEWLKEAYDKKIPTPAGGRGRGAAGVDVANSENGDKAAIAWGTGPKLLAIEEFACPNATHLAYNMLYESTHPFVMEIRRNGTDNAYNDYNTHKLSELGITEDFIGVDVVGIGVATVNAFKDRGWTVQGLSGTQWAEAIPKHVVYDGNGKPKEEIMYKFVSLRAQMYWELREDLRKGLIAIWVEDKAMRKQLERELCIIRFVLKASNIQVESKEDIKKRMKGKSPNIADAVVYWNWVRKGYRLSQGALPFLAAAV